MAQHQGWSGGRESRRKTWTGALWWFPQEGMGREGKQVSLASLTHFNGLWVIGRVSSGLVPGPGVIAAADSGL